MEGAENQSMLGSLGIAGNEEHETGNTVNWDLKKFRRNSTHLAHEANSGQNSNFSKKDELATISIWKDWYPNRQRAVGHGHLGLRGGETRQVETGANL